MQHKIVVVCEHPTKVAPKLDELSAEGWQVHSMQVIVNTGGRGNWSDEYHFLMVKP